MNILRIQNIIGFWVSLFVMVIAGVWTIKTRFTYEPSIAFLTAVLSCISYRTITVRRFINPKIFLYISVITTILLFSAIALLIYFYLISRVILKFTEPHSNEQVYSSAKVSGCYRNIPLNQLIWIVPEDNKLGTFYLGDAVNVPKKGENNGTWDSVNVSIGAYDDGGKSFDIWAILVEQKSPAEDTILKYKQNPYIPSPNSLPPVIRSTKITVLRQP